VSGHSLTRKKNKNVPNEVSVKNLPKKREWWFK